MYGLAVLEKDKLLHVNNSTKDNIFIKKLPLLLPPPPPPPPPNSGSAIIHCYLSVATLALLRKSVAVLPSAMNCSKIAGWNTVTNQITVFDSCGI